MDILEKLRQWLVTYPAWEEGELVRIDFTEGVPGSTGLYPTGLEEVSRVTDVTGGVCVRCRYHFVLYRLTERQEDNEDHARWLLGFQQWVQQQSATGYAPTFGDEPAAERMYAQKGRLQQTNEVGTGKYAVNLTAEFIKYYE